MITEALLGFAIFLVRSILGLLPNTTVNLDMSPLRTLGEWFGSAAAPIDLPFLLSILATWLTGETLLYAARTSVWIYKRMRGG